MNDGRLGRRMQALGADKSGKYFNNERKFMKQTLRSLLLAAAVAASGVAIAQTASYDGATRYLTIPSIRVGDTIFSDLVIRLDGIAVMSVGQTSTTVAVAEKCAIGNFTAQHFNAVALGMTPDQVNQAMGCKYDPTRSLRGSTYLTYVWVVPGTMTYLQVWFNADGSRVTQPANPADPYKFSVGF